MLRFEIELALMENKLEVSDLPEIWNSKMKEYLGISPPDDAKGVLQDIHWSIGYIGYFPTYSLGTIMASQWWNKIEEDIPDLSQQLKRREFGNLHAWLRKNIHQHGSKFDPAELLQRVTGRSLTAEPYLRYLREKYGEIYQL
jgi:carboxypeptidase Taq